MKKISSREELKKIFKDDMSIMIGGFLGCGTPEHLIDLLVEKNIKNLTIISNDTCYPDQGVGKLIDNGQVSKVVTSHIGTNPETGRLMNEGKIQVELVPQGSLVEKIRAGGSGLGGVLTPIGLGTIVEEGKEKLTIQGKEYLLELPIRADIALICGSVSDEDGNVYYKGTTRNFNPIMALAADTVVLESEEIVETGKIIPENVMTPSVLVDYILEGGK
ncbi:MAG: 3-oxoacid CoA-transferase subunit A [Anaerolineaceae bacterium]|nr:3-oxoacid CoA-transferase subunit A [Anaerolineaceae bacterium]